jgi:hypothetical protein
MAEMPDWSLNPSRRAPNQCRIRQHYVPGGGWLK